MPTYVDFDIDRIKTLIKDKGMKQKTRLRPARFVRNVSE